jgi:hypothetical protein
MNSDRIKSWPKEERPREKLLAEGAEKQSDAYLPAVIRQHAAYLTGSADALRRHGGGRVYFEDDEFGVYAHACLAAYRTTVGMPAISRRVRILELFAAQAIVRLSPDERIVGSQRFCRLGFPPEIGQELGALGYGQSSGHIEALLLAYFNRGGFHIHFNSLDAEQLRAAQAAPEQHGNLSIRMSGLSAKFVALSGNVQDALIERAGKGV